MSKKFDLDKYKKSLGASDNPMKVEKFAVLDECLHAVLGMPGLPLGHISQIYGKSDTGKTSLMFHAAAKCQEQGILPVIIVTEGKVDWGRAEAMGLDKDHAIVREDLQFLEEVYEFMDKIASDVISGELPHNVMLFWDSVGNTLSKDEVEIKKDGTYEVKATMMKAAKVNSNYLRSMSAKINSTRRISSPYYVGLTMINTCYTKPPVPPATFSSEVPYGGDQIWFKSTLVLRTKRRKKLDAIKNGSKMGFGIVSAISVEKNHLTNTSHSGEFVITGNAIIPNEKGAIEDYKDAHRGEWGNDFSLVADDGDEFEAGE